MSWYRDMRKDIWKYALVGIILVSIGLNLINYSNLQSSLTRVYLGTSQAAISFSLNLGRATSFLDVNAPEEINQSIQAFTDIGQAALEDLWTVTYLNPPNENTLSAIEAVVTTLFVPQDNPQTVPRVLEQISRASANASTTLNTIADLKAATSQKIEEMGTSVAEAFTHEGGIDVSKLDNAASLANDLSTALNQWISKYSVSS